MAIKIIQNPGSAFGEAIGAFMEEALNRELDKIATMHDSHFISKGPKNKKTGKHKKLILFDNFATGYNIDSVITNESMQPIIIIESKYIRYKKHNRDKGSWVCHAHQALRRRYTSIRSSITVLAGNWSETSQAMMRSHDVNLFLIPFKLICDLLAEHNIDFNWGEKDRKLAQMSWNKYSRLSNKKKRAIGEGMIDYIKTALHNQIDEILNPTSSRKLRKIILEIYTSYGELKIFHCDTLDEAIELLSDFDFDVTMINDDALNVLDPPPKWDDDNNNKD